MHTLKNQRHEQFAQLVASGQPAAKAYREVYGKNVSSARQNASELLTNPDISERVQEIRESVNAETLADCLLTLRAKREFLAKVVRATPGDQDENSPLVQSVKQTESGREIRLCDKLRAIELDAKLAGEFSERFQLQQTNGHQIRVVIGGDV